MMRKRALEQVCDRLFLSVVAGYLTGFKPDSIFI